MAAESPSERDSALSPLPATGEWDGLLAPPSAADRARIFGAALLFSTGGVAIKWIGFGAWQVAGLRALMAAAAVSLLVPGAFVRPTRAVVATGLAQGASMLLFVLANKTTTAANAIFLQCTAPLYIPLLASRVLGEHASRRDLVAMAGIALGLGCFFLGSETPSQTAPAPALGNLFAVASGFAWASTVVGLRGLAREHRTTTAGEGAKAGAATNAGAAKTALVVGNLSVAALALPMALPLERGAPSEWAVLAFLGVVQVSLAYRLLVRAVSKVPALEASLLALFEPVLNPVWAYAFLGERPSAWALVGALVLSVVTIARAVAGDAPDPGTASSRASGPLRVSAGRAAQRRGRRGALWRNSR